MEYHPKALDMAGLEMRPILSDITVVIPTLGRPILEECLFWIINGSAWPAGLVVVDQGRKELVASWVEKIQDLGIDVVYIPSKQRGRAAGLNRGIEQVKTRFFAVTDDDCFVDSDWLQKMSLYLREHPEMIVTGRVEAGNEQVILVVNSSATHVQYRPRLQFDGLSGGNMGTSLDVIRQVGFFDEDPRLRTAEDGEWAYRALRAGVPILYRPDVSIFHQDMRDEIERCCQFRDYARSQGGFYGKYLRKGDVFIAVRVMVHHARALRRWLKGITTNDKEMARFGRAYFFGLTPGIIAGIRN